MIQNPTNLIFPEYPLDGDPLTSAWAQEVKDYLTRAVQTFNAPGLIAGVTAVATGTRVLIKWSADSASSVYRVYRNSTGDFATASVVASVGASRTGVQQLSAQDVNDITIPTLYYWVVGVNSRGMQGPQSAMAIVTNFETAGTNKTCPDTIRTSLFSVAANVGTESAGLLVSYSIIAANSTDVQIETGIMALNLAFGVSVAAVAQVGTALQSLSAGALTVTWLAGIGTGAGLSVTVDTSLNVDSTIYYSVTNNSGRTITII